MKSNSSINVLILGCGTQGLIMVRTLKKSGFNVYLIGEKHNYADDSRYLTDKVYTNLLPKTNEFVQLVDEQIACWNIATMIPMGDVYAEFMSRNKLHFNGRVRYCMPDIKDFETAVDKNELMKLCKEKKYPHPFTVNSFGDITSIDKEKLSFPLLIKPNITCGARGMTLVHSYEELVVKYAAIHNEYGDCHLQKYIKRGGAQVEVQLYIDENRQLVNSSVIYKYRWYPEKGGSSCCAKSVKNDKIVDVLYHLLLDLNWIGFADFDTIEDPDTGELLIMELNPRVPACVKTVVEAGVNWGEIIVNGYLQKTQKSYIYKENEYLRHLGFEILWFLKSPNRFKTRPCWFDFFGKNIHYQDMSDISDIKPFIMGTLRNIKRVLLHSEKKRIER